MPRIVRIVPAVLLVLAAHAAFAQEPGDAARALSQARNSVSSYMATVEVRANELGRKIEVLGYLTDAADSVSPIAMSQSLSRARRKVEEAKHEANEEPPLGEPVPTVVDIVSGIVATPPFGMPADQLRARLFVEISKLEEDILRQSQGFQSELQAVDALESTLSRISTTLHFAAVGGSRASLETRKRALKSGF
jgi:hypothetical protein